MNFEFNFFFYSVVLGIGLAMDAFSVSLANGLNEPKMSKGKMSGIAGTFSAFQFAMPMIGWICVSNIANYFVAFQKCIPWIALFLLSFIGGKMFYEGIKNKGNEEESHLVGIAGLMMQGVATSIDALSVGFTISDYNGIEAFVTCLIIGLVTFVICFIGIVIGKKAGTRLVGKAGILGGTILILIGLEIFINNFI